MQLLPLIVLFILTIIILTGLFILLSFLYFRIKHKRHNILDQQLTFNDSINDPYIQLSPLTHSPSTDRTVKPPSSISTRPSQPRSLNLSRMRASKNNSLSLSIPTINNKTLQTTYLDEFPEAQQKFTYISKLVSYTPTSIQLYTFDVTTITSFKSFKNLTWQYDFKIYPIVDYMECGVDQEGFRDLLDVFKMEKGEYRRVKFVVELTVKNCQEDRLYYVYDLGKTERVEEIGVEEYGELKERFGKGKVEGEEKGSN